MAASAGQWQCLCVPRIPLVAQQPVAPKISAVELTTAVHQRLDPNSSPRVASGAVTNLLLREQYPWSAALVNFLLHCAGR
jgi:hypothetical protein